MKITSPVSRRAALRSLLAVLASAAGMRASASNLSLAQDPPSEGEGSTALTRTNSSTSELALSVPVETSQPSAALTQGNFRTIYSDQQLQDRFYLFLQNVYHLYPENQFHQLIIDVAAEYDTDQEIYLQLVERIPEIAPLFSLVTYGLPSLAKQKEEMSRQSEALLGSSRPINSYLEIGTSGQYRNARFERIPILAQALSSMIGNPPMDLRISFCGVDLAGAETWR